MRYQLGQFFLPLLHVLQNIAVQVFATVGIFFTDVWGIGQFQRLYLHRPIKIQKKAMQTNIHAPERDLNPWPQCSSGTCTRPRGPCDQQDTINNIVERKKVEIGDTNRKINLSAD
jgi:hypothetical protein